MKEEKPPLVIARLTAVPNTDTVKGFCVTTVRRPEALRDKLADQSVTFSRKAWKDTWPPKIGTDVVLNDIRHHEGKGWRAEEARYFRPYD